MLIPPKKGKIFCHACKKPITGARTVIEGHWHCSACTYAHDYPDKEIPARVPTKRARRYDGPTLFDTEGFTRRERERD